MLTSIKKENFRILVADDDEIAREVIKAILSEAGYSVVLARDGLDALRVLRVTEINLVLTDLRMPGADGIEVLKHVVRNEPDTAVIIMTAFGALDSTLKVIKEGAYYYLTKPFKGEEVVLIADRAYQMTLLIKEKRELASLLKDTYRDIGLLNTVVDRDNPEISGRWAERIERLTDMGVLATEEAEILGERLVAGNGKR